MSIKHNMLRSSLKHGALWIGGGWAFFVLIRYLGIDDGFFFDLIQKLELKNISQYIVSCILVIMAGVIFGYTYGQTHSRKIIIGIVGLVFLGFVEYFAPTLIESIGSKFNNLSDGFRASLVIALAGLFGIGIGLGIRISQHPLTLGFLAICLLLPFIFVTLRAGAIASLLALVWLFLLSDALGMYTLRLLNSFFNFPSLSIDRAGLLSIAVGLSILILVTLGLGLVGGVHTTGILLMLILLTLLCFAQIKFALVRLIASPWKQPITLSEFELGGIAMLTSLFFIYWIGALAPEVGADALGVRAAAPAIWLRDGIIRPIPEMLYSYAMFGGEMLYLLVMPFTGYPAAKVVQFGLSILLVVSAFTQVFELRHRREAAMILFIFWGCTQVWWQMIWGFADMSQMFFYFVCILAVRYWLDEPENPIWLVVAGITSATSISVKLNGGGALLIAGLVVVGVTLHQTRSLTKVIKNGLYLVFPSILYLLPWLIRSYLLTQNPVFPFANEIFRSPLVIVLPMTPFGVGMSFPEVLTVPWGIFFDPAVYGSFTYHPLILALAFLGLIGLAWVPSRKEWLWFAAGLLAYITWLVTEQNSRYSLYAIYLLTLAFSIGLLKWQDAFSEQFRRTIFQAILLIGLAWGFGMQALRPSFWLQSGVSGPAFPARVVLGGQSEVDYLRDYVPTYFCVQWLNRNYGQNARVWQIPPIRDLLYVDAPASNQPWSILSITQPLDEILYNPDTLVGNSAIHQRLIKGGYTHLLTHNSLIWWLSGIPEPQRKGLFDPDFESTYLELKCADRGVRLYEIRQIPLPDNSIQVPSSLVLNPGFETLTSDGLPLDWAFSGRGQIIDLDGNNVFSLEQDATLSQSVIVNSGDTYELSTEYKITSTAPVGYIQTNWLDSTGQLRLFWREAFNPVEGFDFYRFQQTAPDGVQTVIIYVSGSGIEVDNVIFREIADEVEAP